MKDSLHKKLMIRISALLVFIITSIFLIVNIYFTYERKKNMLEIGRAMSTLVLKKARENLQNAEGDLLTLSGLALDLQRTVEGSDSLKEMAFIDTTTGRFASHNDASRIDTKVPEEFLKVQGNESLIKYDGTLYAIYQLSGKYMDGLKLIVGFLDTGATGLQGRFLSLQFLLFLFSIVTAYGLTSRFIQFHVLKPLEKLRRHSKQLQEGDLSHYATILEYDEIGALTEAFNNMTDSIRNIIMKIVKVSSNLYDVAGKLSDVTENIKQVSEEEYSLFTDMENEVEKVSKRAMEISEKMQYGHSTVENSAVSLHEASASLKQVETEMKNLRKHIDDVSSSIKIIHQNINGINTRVELLMNEIEETSVSINEISSSSHQVEQITSEANKIALKASEISKEGMAAAEATNTGMRKIHNVIHEITSSVKNLEKRTAEIQEILTVIQNIAGQTNLLAINASIIASQAGEQGKSFAVVAEHIKNLASKTALSTRDIENIIKTVSKDVQKTVELVDVGLQSVEEGQVLSSNSLNILKKLEEASIKTASTMEMIARAMEEQTRATEKVAEASQKINEHIQEIYSSTKEQTEAAENISDASERMRTFSEEVMRATEEQAKAAEEIIKMVDDVRKTTDHITNAAEEQKNQLLKTSTNISKGVTLMGEVTKRIEDIYNSMMDVSELSEILQKEITKFKLN